MRAAHPGGAARPCASLYLCPSLPLNQRPPHPQHLLNSLNLQLSIRAPCTTAGRRSAAQRVRPLPALWVHRSVPSTLQTSWLLPRACVSCDGQQQLQAGQAAQQRPASRCRLHRRPGAAGGCRQFAIQLAAGAQGRHQVRVELGASRPVAVGQPGRCLSISSSRAGDPPGASITGCLTVHSRPPPLAPAHPCRPSPRSPSPPPSSQRQTTQQQQQMVQQQRRQPRQH